MSRRVRQLAMLIVASALAAGAVGQTWIGTNFGAALHDVDPASGSTRSILNLSGLQSVGIIDLTVDPSNGTVLAIDGGFTKTRSLVTLDLNGGSATRIGAVPDGLAGLAFTPDGVLWGLTGDGGTPPRTLFTIDPATAAATPLTTVIDHGRNGEVLSVGMSGDLHRIDGSVWTVIDPTTLIESFAVDLAALEPSFGEAAGLQSLPDGSHLVCDTGGVLHRVRTTVEVIGSLAFGTPRGILDLSPRAVEHPGTGEIDTAWSIGGSPLRSLDSGVNDSVAVVPGDLIGVVHAAAPSASNLSATGDLLVIGSVQATGLPFTEVFPRLYLSPTVFVVAGGGPLFPLVLPIGYALVYPGGAAGSSLLLQALVAAPIAANGIFASAAGLELILL